MEIKKDGNYFVDSETRTFCDVENVAKNQLRKNKYLAFYRIRF